MFYIPIITVVLMTILQLFQKEFELHPLRL